MEKKLTRFEKTRILGARTLQLSYGAKKLVKTKGTSREIAESELEKKVLPIEVVE